MTNAHLLIDTDPGVDDALAILMAYRHAMVSGLCVTAGNVGLAHTVRNALKLVEVVGVETPVFPGCARPLVLPAEDAAFVHGADGFGDIGFTASTRAPVDEHAALAIVRLARAHRGALTLVALGPLTNLALALRLEPQLPHLVGRLVIMGGAVNGRGNTPLVPAEFNIGFDPEAAHVVFSEWPHFDLVDWEATLRHGLDFAKVERWLATGDARARFFAAISRRTRDWTRTRGRPALMTADALAMAVALEPGIATEVAERAVAIELGGSLTRGATVVDWEGRLGHRPNARIIGAIDHARFEALVAAALGAPC